MTIKPPDLTTVWLGEPPAPGIAFMVIREELSFASDGRPVRTIQEIKILSGPDLPDFGGICGNCGNQKVNWDPNAGWLCYGCDGQSR